MNEWIVAGAVTIGFLVLVVGVIWLKENHLGILVGIVVGILGFFVFFGLVSVVRDLIYYSIPAWMGR